MKIKHSARNLYHWCKFSKWIYYSTTCIFEYTVHTTTHSFFYVAPSKPHIDVKLSEVSVTKPTIAVTNVHNPFCARLFYERQQVVYWSFEFAPFISSIFGTHTLSHVVWSPKNFDNWILFCNRLVIFRMLRNNVSSSSLVKV